jgi:hypothetical protein
VAIPPWITEICAEDNDLGHAHLDGEIDSSMSHRAPAEELSFGEILSRDGITLTFEIGCEALAGPFLEDRWLDHGRVDKGRIA